MLRVSTLRSATAASARARRSSLPARAAASALLTRSAAPAVASSPALQALVARAFATAAQTQPSNSKGAAANEAPSADALAWPADVAKRVHKRLRSFPRNYEAKALAVEAGLNAGEWALAAAAFRQAFMRTPAQFFRDQSELEAFARDLLDDGSDVHHAGAKTKRNSFVFYPFFLDFARGADYMPRSSSNDGSGGDGEAFTLQELTDLRLPHELYPFATAMKRKIVYHEGPTNSGKTFAALERLKQAGADGGIYCGPLRLLALEVFEKLNADGLYTSLVTGQEKKLVPFASHVACTVEMANINRKWDVAVIDEIQLIGDPQRGWAWTRAFFGLQANEIHVCGSGEAMDLLRKFAETTGDDFEVRTYERRASLQVADAHLESFRNVQPGDCVVAFSRRELFQLKRDIEVKTGQKCCIIYGQLPPETRSQQARLFNARDNEYNILVASDAVGMGLNLNIGRVVFSTVKKFGGARAAGLVDIPPALAKQIAGRAGRAGGAYEATGGVATTLVADDLEYLKESFEQPQTPLKAAGLFPSSEQMEEFAKQLPGITDLGDLIDKYVMLARLDGDYFLCNHSEMKDAAALLRDIELSLSDRFTFCMAPANLRHPLARRVFVDYARAHAQEQSVALDIYLPKYAPQTAESLRDVEIKAQIIDLYLWLSFRFEPTFTEKELALELKARVLELVEQGLINTTVNRDTRKKPRSSVIHYAASRNGSGSGSGANGRPQYQRDGRRGDYSKGRKLAGSGGDVERRSESRNDDADGADDASDELDAETRSLTARLRSQWRKFRNSN